MDKSQKVFTFGFLYNQKTNFFDFPLLESHLKKLSEESQTKIDCHFIEIQEIEAKTKEIPLLDMVCCLPAEAPYISTVLQKYPNIKWVHSLFAGVDKFLQIEKVKKDSSIILTNARGAYSDALAEYTILALLYFNYNIPTYLTSFTKREWQRPLNELVDKKTITIIGYGKNGIGIAKRVKPAFNMKVIGVVRVKRDNVEGKEYCDEVIGFDGLNDEIIGQSDYILATLPQTAQSVNLFDKKFFAKMKKTGIFINIGRGSAVVEDDLVEALTNGTIKGAVLDVTQKEPLDKTSKLYDVPKEKLLITNHSGDVTSSYVEQSYAVLLKNLKSYLMNNKKLETIVNKELGY